MNHPNDARRLVPDEVKQKALDLCLHEVEGFAGLSAAKKTDIHGMVVRLLAAPASPLPEGGGQCSGITGELSGWQDISTAPKDGTPLLAGSIHHSDREVVCWQDGLPSGSMDTDAAWEGWVNDGPQKDRFYVNPRYFTHFMPLPAAPTGAK